MPSPRGRAPSKYLRVFLGVPRIAAAQALTASLNLRLPGDGLGGGGGAGADDEFAGKFAVLPMFGEFGGGGPVLEFQEGVDGGAADGVVVAFDGGEAGLGALDAVAHADEGEVLGDAAAEGLCGLEGTEGEEIVGAEEGGEVGLVAQEGVGLGAAAVEGPLADASPSAGRGDVGGDEGFAVALEAAGGFGGEAGFGEMADAAMAEGEEVFNQEAGSEGIVAVDHGEVGGADDGVGDDDRHPGFDGFGEVAFVSVVVDGADDDAGDAVFEGVVEAGDLAVDVVVGVVEEKAVAVVEGVVLGGHDESIEGALHGAADEEGEELGAAGKDDVGEAVGAVVEGLRHGFDA